MKIERFQPTCDGCEGGWTSEREWICGICDAEQPGGCRLLQEEDPFIPFSNDDD